MPAQLATNRQVLSGNMHFSFKILMAISRFFLEKLFKFHSLKRLERYLQWLRKWCAWICSQIAAEPLGRAPLEGRRMKFQ